MLFCRLQQDRRIVFMQKNKTNIKIRGKEYTVVGPETPEYMQKIASYIDNKIGEMMVANPTLNEMGSVLAAINIVDSTLKPLKLLII